MGPLVLFAFSLFLQPNWAQDLNDKGGFWKWSRINYFALAASLLPLLAGYLAINHYFPNSPWYLVLAETVAILVYLLAQSVWSDLKIRRASETTMMVAFVALAILSVIREIVIDGSWVISLTIFLGAAFLMVLMRGPLGADGVAIAILLATSWQYAFPRGILIASVSVCVMTLLISAFALFKNHKNELTSSKTLTVPLVPIVHLGTIIGIAISAWSDISFALNA